MTNVSDTSAQPQTQRLRCWTRDGGQVACVIVGDELLTARLYQLRQVGRLDLLQRVNHAERQAWCGGPSNPNLGKAFAEFTAGDIEVLRQAHQEWTERQKPIPTVEQIRQQQLARKAVRS